MRLSPKRRTRPCRVCEAVPCAALDAQSILRLARRVGSTRVRVEPDTSHAVDDVRAGRCPRMRAAVDEACRAVCALEAPDNRAMLARRVRRMCPSRDTRPRGPHFIPCTSLVLFLSLSPFSLSWQPIFGVVRNHVFLFSLLFFSVIIQRVRHPHNTVNSFQTFQLF